MPVSLQIGALNDWQPYGVIKKVIWHRCLGVISNFCPFFTKACQKRETLVQCQNYWSTWYDNHLNVISSAYSCRWCIVPWSMIYGTCFQSVRADFAVYFLLLDSVAVVRRESTEVLGVSLPREKAFICIYRCSANPCTNIIPLKRNSQLLRCNKNQVWQTA